MNGKKMITVKVRFWTNEAAAGDFQPKHAWAAGMVNVETNPLHGIDASLTLPFHSLLDIGSVIEKVLIRDGIKLHVGKKMAKYVEAN